MELVIGPNEHQTGRGVGCGQAGLPGRGEVWCDLSQLLSQVGFQAPPCLSELLLCSLLKASTPRVQFTDILIYILIYGKRSLSFFFDDLCTYFDVHLAFPSFSLIVSPSFPASCSPVFMYTHVHMKTCVNKSRVHPNAIKTVGALHIFISPKMFSASLLEGCLYTANNSVPVF